MKRLTAKEEEIMGFFWTKGPLFVKELLTFTTIHKPHFNTLSTIVRGLEEKGYLSHEAFGNTYRYFAIVTEDSFRTRTLKSVISKYFNNSFLGTVSSLVKKEDISIEELKELIRQVEEGETKRNNKQFWDYGSIFVYILKSSLCLAVFYLFYQFFISKTFHRCNRMALLSIILLSYILPLATITTNQHTMVGLAVITVRRLADSQRSRMWFPIKGLQPEFGFPWQEINNLLRGRSYIFILCHLWSLGRMLYFIRHNQRKQLPDGTLLIIHSCNFAPFSWMKYIVISQADLKENGHDILLHEQAHIRNHHSWDLLLVEVCSWLQWFNPAIWPLKQELQNIHEYEADEEVLRQGIDARQYQMLLIKKAVGARLYSIANSFNHSSLKKRIT